MFIAAAIVLAIAFAVFMAWATNDELSTLESALGTAVLDGRLDSDKANGYFAHAVESHKNGVDRKNIDEWNQLVSKLNHPTE